MDFYITLPSNTKTDLKNKTNSFTIRLQQKLQFNSTWVVGLVSILYPYSWPNVGTDGFQFIDIAWKTGVVTRLYIRSTTFRTLENLHKGIEAAIREGAQRLCSITDHASRKRRAVESSKDRPDNKRLRRSVQVPEEEEEAHPPLDPEYIAAKSAEALTAEKARLTGELSTVRAELTQLRKDHAAAVKTFKDREKTLTDQKNALQLSSDAGKQQYHQLTADIATVRNEKLVAQKKYEDQVKRLTAEVETLKSSISELVVEKESAQKTIAEKDQQLVEKDQQLEEARTRLTDYEARQGELQARVTELETQPLPEPSLTIPEGCTIVAGDPYARVAEFVRLHYDEEAQRFTLKMNPTYITSVKLSDQLAYMLGFDTADFTEERKEARYMPDLHGGVHSLYVHAPKLIEPTMIGDTWAPILRIAKVKGGPGDFVEDVFLTPQYHKVLEKQVSEISMQIRTSTGRLVPFNWGNCTLVLHFKKLSIF